MPTLELPPPPTPPTPVPALELRGAFDSLFTEFANKPQEDLLEAPTRKSIGEVHRAAHVITTWTTPFAKSVEGSAGAFEDYYFTRHGMESTLAGKFDVQLDKIIFDRAHALMVVRPAIQAYVFSGLAIPDFKPVLAAANAFHQDRFWVKSAIDSGREDALKALDTQDVRYKWNRKHINALAKSALNSVASSDSKKLAKDQKTSST